MSTEITKGKETKETKGTSEGEEVETVLETVRERGRILGYQNQRSPADLC